MCLGIPGRIVEIVDPENLIATVDVAGVKRPVNIACITEEGMPVSHSIGCWVLVHVGFAMSKINESEAKETLELLATLAEFQEEMQAMSENGAGETP